jgi:hypothetical protein
VLKANIGGTAIAYQKWHYSQGPKAREYIAERSNFENS